MAKKVLVVMGGFSAERDVSLSSGQDIADALKTKGYEVVLHDLQDVWTFIEVLRKESPMWYLTGFMVIGARTAHFRDSWICCKFLIRIRECVHRCSEWIKS